MRMRPPRRCSAAELYHAHRDSAARLAVARIRRRSSPVDVSRVVLASKPDLMARGVAFNLLQMAKRVSLQCKAAKYEDLSGEEDLPLDCIAIDDRRSHRA